MGRGFLDIETETYSVYNTMNYRNMIVREFVDDDHNWQGISGDYVVTLGENSFAESGNSPNLPTLSASVGAFSRMWFGIRDASSLALTDTLDGPMGLLKDLDRGIRLPTANSGWEF